MEIGFNRTVYSVNEGETAVVCVNLSGPEVIDSKLIAVFAVSTIPGTASGEFLYSTPNT